MTEKRSLHHQRSFRDDPGCKNVGRMGSRNGAISEEKGTRRSGGIIEGVFEEFFEEGVVIILYNKHYMIYHT